MTAALALLLLCADAATAQPPAATTATVNDPASSVFANEAGIILVQIKATAVADYELVIRTLNEALVKDTDATRKEAVKGWRVFRATEVDAKGNAVFVHTMFPAVLGFDYRPSMLIDTLVKELAPDLLSKYQEAFAGPPAKLSLTEIANMTLMPVTPEVKKPGGR